MEAELAHAFARAGGFAATTSVNDRDIVNSHSHG